MLQSTERSIASILFNVFLVYFPYQLPFELSSSSSVTSLSLSVVPLLDSSYSYNVCLIMLLKCPGVVP